MECGSFAAQQATVTPGSGSLRILFSTRKSFQSACSLEKQRLVQTIIFLRATKFGFGLSHFRICSQAAPLCSIAQHDFQSALQSANTSTSVR